MITVKLIPQALLNEIARERHRQEVSEAVSSAGRGDAKHTREELVQVAAVAIRFIDAIDRGEVGF